MSKKKQKKNWSYYRQQLLEDGPIGYWPLREQGFTIEDWIRVDDKWMHLVVTVPYSVRKKKRVQFEFPTIYVNGTAHYSQMDLAVYKYPMTAEKVKQHYSSIYPTG